MFTKSQSCDRCFRQAPPSLDSTQTLTKTKAAKKPEAYLAKKFEQLYDEDRKQRDKKKNKIQLITKQKQQKEIEQCTFKPEINNNAEFYVNKDPFLKREEDWKRNIDKKIAEKRDQQTKKQKDSFTFQPKITEIPLTTSQIKQGRSMNNHSYSTKSSFVQKRSYKVLHSERKKFKQITKSIIVEPFKHRRLHTTFDGNPTLENTTHSLQPQPQGQTLPTKPAHQSEKKSSLNHQQHEVSIENQEQADNYPHPHSNELEKLNFETETNEVEDPVREVEVEEEEQGQTF